MRAGRHHCWHCRPLNCVSSVKRRTPGSRIWVAHSRRHGPPLGLSPLSRKVVPVCIAVAAGRHVDCRLHGANTSSGKVILHPSAQLWPGHEVRAVQDSRICPAASRGTHTPPTIASAIPSRFCPSSARQSPIGHPGSHGRHSSEQASPRRANTLSRPSRSWHRTNQRQTRPFAPDFESSPSAVRRPARPHMTDTHIPHSPTSTHDSRGLSPTTRASDDSSLPSSRHPSASIRARVHSAHRAAVAILLPDIFATPLCASKASGTCPFFSSPARPDASPPHTVALFLRYAPFLGLGRRRLCIQGVFWNIHGRFAPRASFSTTPRSAEKEEKKKKSAFFSKESSPSPAGRTIGTGPDDAKEKRRGKRHRLFPPR